MRERAEASLRVASLVVNHEPVLARTLGFDDIDDRTLKVRLHVPHNTLVDLERVLARLLVKY